MPTLISKSPDETYAIGKSWGRVVESGWVVGLIGDLGVGKTQLVKGLAHGLGVSARVHSPTFGLVNEYGGGRLPLFHVDLYRLETGEQIVGAGLESFFYNPAGVAVIEWIDRWGDLRAMETPRLGGLFRRVHIEQISEAERRIEYEDFVP